jgi:hypothetical protein
MPQETPTDSRPHFVIPYWTPVSAAEAPDDGDVRPLPSKACWYLCPAIHASPYTPGEQLDVTVEVANYGGANTASLAQVAVWWSDPTAGFVVSPDKVIGYDTVSVQGRGGTGTTKTLSKVIPATAPNHICLLARVSHQYDRAGVAVAPGSDRHWAQRNISHVAASPGIPAMFEFLVGNPFLEETEFLLSAEPAFDEERLRILTQELPGSFMFTDVEISLNDDGPRTRIALAPGEQTMVRCVVTLAGPIEREHYMPIEIALRQGDDGPIVGGIGLLITPE